MRGYIIMIYHLCFNAEFLFFNGFFFATYVLKTGLVKVCFCILNINRIFAKRIKIGNDERKRLS